MEPINAVDLAAVAAHVVDEVNFEQTALVARQVRGIHNNVAGWKAQLKQAEQTVMTLRSKIGSAEMKLEEIAKGNWSAVPDPKQEGTRSVKEAEQPQAWPA